MEQPSDAITKMIYTDPAKFGVAQPHLVDWIHFPEDVDPQWSHQMIHAGREVKLERFTFVILPPSEHPRGVWRFPPEEIRYIEKVLYIGQDNSPNINGPIYWANARKSLESKIRDGDLTVEEIEYYRGDVGQLTPEDLI